MNSGDFRGFERTFSLLTQVVGRSGRGETPGKAYIQTLDPENNVIKLAAAQDYETFYNEEILTRKLMVYPPYCDILSVVTAAQSQQMAAKAVQGFVDLLTEKLKKDFTDIKLIILRPTPTAVPRVGGKYRYRVIIKCKMGSRVRELITDVLDEYYQNSYSKYASVYVDVNPESNI